jgi:hypothetical protein
MEVHSIGVLTTLASMTPGQCALIEGDEAMGTCLAFMLSVNEEKGALIIPKKPFFGNGQKQRFIFLKPDHFQYWSRPLLLSEAIIHPEITSLKCNYNELPFSLTLQRGSFSIHYKPNYGQTIYFDLKSGAQINDPDQQGWYFERWCVLVPDLAELSGYSKIFSYDSTQAD